MTSYVCFLPFRGELGWYLMSYVRMIHGYDHPNKIVCIKRGHECLFPTAQNFFYDWSDIPDDHKAGVIPMDDEEEIKDRIMLQFPHDQISFVSHTTIDWGNRHSFTEHSFIPESKSKFGFKVDVVITPRQRKIDVLRNWHCSYWQILVNALVAKGLVVGLCGTKETSCELENVQYKSYEYIDIDSDVELMNSAKLVVTQESGLQYLSFLCKRPTFCVGHYMGDMGSDLYRDFSVPFKELKHVVDYPELLVDEVLNFLGMKGEE